MDLKKDSCHGYWPVYLNFISILNFTPYRYAKIIIMQGKRRGNRIDNKEDIKKV